ncbi:hypothetical protein HH308_23705 [Gordonia sp. TBRC 11910]|uniref:Ribbon-helix-helix protein CopG domain-containing protein n=1 Tax=Gordonia asplenii TaxID=2725283 RepID=A0A848L9G9_9ACTN|nr:hypothetical protein [Gordonia asplenii]NMO04228.1 hypothetical protein [Gordonia asplenii]
MRRTQFESADAVLERRLQLLLDQRQYDRVAAEAKRSGRSVAAVIRSAIDSAYPSDVDERHAAVHDLPAMSTNTEDVGDDWPTVKAQAARELDRELSCVMTCSSTGTAVVGSPVAPGTGRDWVPQDAALAQPDDVEVASTSRSPIAAVVGTSKELPSGNAGAIDDP